MNETSAFGGAVNGVLRNVQLCVVALVAAAPAVSSPLPLEVQSYKGFDRNCPRCDLRSQSLRDAHLIGADLRQADLRDADLRGANLEGADLSGARLSGADLRGANLTNAELSGVDLRQADLRHAVVINAFAPNVQVEGVRFAGANLTGSHLIIGGADYLVGLILAVLIEPISWGVWHEGNTCSFEIEII